MKKTYEQSLYFVEPKVNSVKNYENHEIGFHINNMFHENTPIKTEQDFQKTFSPKIIRNNKKLDFSRALEESWSESFAFIFNWLKNGFDVYDLFILNSRYSNQRVLIKVLSKPMIYILNNIDWEKLGIRQSIYLKRKVSIKKLLKHIEDMPVTLKTTYNRPISNKKFSDYDHLLKSII